MMHKPDFMVRLGERIHRLRTKADVSQSELAKRISSSQGAIMHAEQGTTCSVYLLVCISEALDLNLYDLLVDSILDHKDAAE